MELAVDLTAPLPPRAAANKAAVTAARTALVAAVKTQDDYLRTVAVATTSEKVTLADDGTCVIVG